LEGEILVIPLSPKVVLSFRPRTKKYFPTPSYTTPPPVRVTSFTETPVPSIRVAFSSNSLLFPFPPKISAPIFPAQTPSPPSYPPPIIPMAGANPPRNRMDAIVATRYAPLVLPHPTNALLVGDYLKYMPKFMGEEDITTKENHVAFYSYAYNLKIENEDVWMRVFVQSLDGEVRKGFRGLTPRYIDGIESLDDVLLRQCGDKKDFMCYITKFGSLKRKEGESVFEFSKRFNKIYNKIPVEIKTTKASAKITYSSAFDLDFYLMLREIRATSFSLMQYASLEVESNVLAVDKLRNKSDRDTGSGRSEASTSGYSVSHTQVDELTNMVKSMSAEMEKMKF
jgi:hypothetical protein